MPVSFPCSKCQSIIKISSKIPHGTPVQCPSCGNVFGNPSKITPAGAPMPVIEQPAAPSRPHKHRHSRRRFHRLRRLPAGLGLSLPKALLILLGMVVLGAGAGGLYLITHRSGATVVVGGGARDPNSASGDGAGDFNKGTGQEDPLAYVPADANLILGYNAGAASSQPALKALLDQVLAPLGLAKSLADAKSLTGLEFKELFDTTIVAVKTTQPESTTFILKSSEPFDQRKLSQWVTSTPPKEMKGKFYFDKHKDILHLSTVYVPSDRIVVLSDIPAANWEALFSTDGSKPALAAELVALVRRAEKSAHWSVQPFDAQLKPAVLEGKGPPELALFSPPETQETFKKVAADARGLASWINLEGGKLKMGLALGCGTPAAADELTKGLQAGWAKTKDARIKDVDGLAQFGKDIQTLYKEGLSSLQYANQDALATATVTLGAGALEPLAKGGPAALQKNTQELYALAGRPTAVVAAPPPPDPKGLNLSPEEQQLLAMVNEARAEAAKKMPPLKAHPKLFEVARAYAAVMAKQGKEGDDVDGKNYLQRLQATGYKIKKIDGDDWAAVNIASDENLGPGGAYEKWLKNAATKEFLLDKYEETGIGIAKNDKNVVYYYMIYAIPDK